MKEKNMFSLGHSFAFGGGGWGVAMNEWMDLSFQETTKTNSPKKKIGKKKFGERKEYVFFRGILLLWLGGVGGRMNEWMNEWIFLFN